MSALKEGTADLHRRLERRLVAADRFSALDAYTEHLSRLAAFHVSAENQWAEFLTPVLSDFTDRRKAPLLMRDLAHLGGIAQVSCEVPVVADGAAALGAFYVLEGATLGGRFLLKAVRVQLGLDTGRGASYLASYGEEVSAMWERFGAAVDAECGDPTTIARAVAAARATFIALEDQLCGDPA